MKVSFKKHPKSNGSSYTGSYIKLDEKVFGIINPPKQHSVYKTWTISFAVKKLKSDNNSNFDWKWVSIENTFDSKTFTKEWIKANIDRITEKYTLHFFED